MDARPHPAHSQHLTATPLQHAELRAVLTHLSHELCRPLSSLRAGFELLLGDSDRPVSLDQRGHLETMAAVCDDLLGLTRSYLDYAGLVQGARPLQYGDFTIGALAREIDRQFARKAAERRIAWECVLEGPDRLVATDASRCQQIFANLVSNALKYTPEGGRVRVLARREGAWWSLAVSDTGPGIPVEAISKVFEPFYRLAREERSGVEGNGLGLTICREMVNQLQGEISIAAEQGNSGTRATVRLPVELPEAVMNL
jgi:signal transduction histidine kinase